MNLKEFLNSEFAKNVLNFNGKSTEWHIGERDRLITTSERVFFKSYWDNGKQACSKNILLKKAENINVELTRNTRIFNSSVTSNCWLRFKDNNKLDVSYLIPRRCTEINSTGQFIPNTYELNVIQHSPWTIEDGDYID